MGEQNFCVRGFILTFPFPNKSLLYVQLEMVRSTRSHPSTNQVVKAPQKALWIGRVEGSRQSLVLGAPPSGPVSLPVLPGGDRAAVAVAAKWRGTDTGNSFMYC